MGMGENLEVELPFKIIDDAGKGAYPKEVDIRFTNDGIVPACEKDIDEDDRAAYPVIGTGNVAEKRFKTETDKEMYIAYGMLGDGHIVLRERTWFHVEELRSAFKLWEQGKFHILQTRTIQTRSKFKNIWR